MTTEYGKEDLTPHKTKIRYHGGRSDGASQVHMKCSIPSNNQPIIPARPSPLPVTSCKYHFPLSDQHLKIQRSISYLRRTIYCAFLADFQSSLLQLHRYDAMALAKVSSRSVHTSQIIITADEIHKGSHNLHSRKQRMRKPGVADTLVDSCQQSRASRLSCGTKRH